MPSAPEYSIGQKLVKSVKAVVEGNQVLVEVTHHIVAIKVESTETSYAFLYKVANRFPSAYNEPSWVSDWIYGTRIKDTYKGVLND